MFHVEHFTNCDGANMTLTNGANLIYFFFVHKLGLCYNSMRKLGVGRVASAGKHKFTRVLKMIEKSVKLSTLKKGEWFTICDHDGQEVQPWQVYVRDDYDRSTKKYICTHWDNIGRSRQLKGSTRVFVNFIF